MLAQQGVAMRCLAGAHCLQVCVQNRFELAVLGGVIGCGIDGLLQVADLFSQPTEAALQDSRGDRQVRWCLDGQCPPYQTVTTTLPICWFDSR
jgi:hypothetical protein